MKLSLVCLLSCIFAVVFPSRITSLSTKHSYPINVTIGTDHLAIKVTKDGMLTVEGTMLHPGTQMVNEVIIKVYKGAEADYKEYILLIGHPGNWIEQRIIIRGGFFDIEDQLTIGERRIVELGVEYPRYILTNLQPWNHKYRMNMGCLKHRYFIIFGCASLVLVGILIGLVLWMDNDVEFDEDAFPLEKEEEEEFLPPYDPEFKV